MAAASLFRLVAFACVLLSAAPAWSQNDPPGGGTTEPAPDPAPAPNPAPAPAPPGAANPSALAGLPTLVPSPTDADNPDEVTLPERPVAMLSGRGTWDEAFNTLSTAFATIEAELAKANIAPTGRPLTVFSQTDDSGFHYDAMIPIETMPPDQESLGANVRFGHSPAGNAVRFVHKAPYDEIDSTYDTVTAYLDTKGITVQDSFVEEYVSDLSSGSDPGLEIYIYAFPK